MYSVLKRDGKLVDFDLSKISTAITQAFEACQIEYHNDIVDFLALKVTAEFAPKIQLKTHRQSQCPNCGAEVGYEQKCEYCGHKESKIL